MGGLSAAKCGRQLVLLRLAWRLVHMHARAPTLSQPAAPCPTDVPSNWLVQKLLDDRNLTAIWSQWTPAQRQMAAAALRQMFRPKVRRGQGAAGAVRLTGPGWLLRASCLQLHLPAPRAHCTSHAPAAPSPHPTPQAPADASCPKVTVLRTYADLRAVLAGGVPAAQTAPRRRLLVRGPAAPRARLGLSTSSAPCCL